MSKMDDIDCRLILPGKKEDKGRIVFASGLYVEIDREVFRNFEQKVLDEKPEYQKIQSNSSINVASDSKDMPMIVTNDCLDDEEHKTSQQLKVADKQLKSIPILKNAKTPPPSSTSPLGLHKLPSIVSKPSYYAKYENRKVFKVI
eukprot:GFUD01134342.1.p1 GENE.GFUD01134342.1~~GFUD01134342.1.p1  ORF type:complete len:169 (+),score=50.28 GFUD01134342.1:73-507(+)